MCDWFGLHGDGTFRAPTCFQPGKNSSGSAPKLSHLWDKVNQEVLRRRFLIPGFSSQLMMFINVDTNIVR